MPCDEVLEALEEEEEVEVSPESPIGRGTVQAMLERNDLFDVGDITVAVIRARQTQLTVVFEADGKRYNRRIPWHVAHDRAHRLRRVEVSTVTIGDFFENWDTPDPNRPVDKYIAKRSWERVETPHGDIFESKVELVDTTRKEGDDQPSEELLLTDEQMAEAQARLLEERARQVRQELGLPERR